MKTELAQLEQSLSQYKSVSGVQSVIFHHPDAWPSIRQRNRTYVVKEEEENEKDKNFSV
jgi:hypothetical protein